MKKNEFDIFKTLVKRIIKEYEEKGLIKDFNDKRSYIISYLSTYKIATYDKNGDYKGLVDARFSSGQIKETFDLVYI